MKKGLFFKLGLLMTAILTSLSFCIPAMAAPTLSDYCGKNPTASICTGGEGDCLKNPTAGNCRAIEPFVKTLMDYMLAAVGVLAVILIIWSGIRMTIFHNNDTKTWGKARNILLYAVIALVVASLAWVIVNLTVNIAEDMEQASWTEMVDACVPEGKVWDPVKMECV